MTLLVDSHCHLDFPDFAEDLDGVVSRAGAAGVGLMLTIGTKLHAFPAVRGVAERFPNIYCSVGVHPHEAENDWGYAAETLIAETHHPKVVAIGETGLDYFYDHSPRELQQKSFRAHCDASRRTGLPMVIHTRDADDDTISLLESELAHGPFTGVIHCFTGTRRLAEACLAMGFYISISGIITFKSAADLKQTVAEAVPLEKLLVETDSPYLAPIPHRGKRNEPAFTRKTAECVAGLKGVSIETLADVTTANFFTLFNKVPRAALLEQAA
ncbi:TatD family hydrolase [Elstera litoralis]|uniref:TatD family hydrolase n=1 Tax=Elstera litoralis TaxID=552518 RepID=UPI000AB92CCC